MYQQQLKYRLLTSRIQDIHRQRKENVKGSLLLKRPIYPREVEPLIDYSFHFNASFTQLDDVEILDTVPPLIWVINAITFDVQDAFHYLSGC